MSRQVVSKRAFASLNGSPKPTDVVFVGAARTAVGTFRGALSKFSAPQLGSIAIKGALEKAGVKPEQVDEVFMGNVISAGMGQAPARQAALGAGLPVSTVTTTVNKVCASGMKTVELGGLTLAAGLANVVVAGGMESMSNVPFYVPRGHGYGNTTMYDGILRDGLTDVYDDIHMGICAEETAQKYGFTREQQDAHAVQSYTRSAEAWKRGQFANEIVPVVIKDKKKDVAFAEDEEYKKIDFSKIPQLKSAFKKDGTVTAANSSTLNDGASALVMTTRGFAEENGLKPIAELISMGDAETNPKLFTIAPSLALPIALKRAGVSKDDISLFEFNEAFSVVCLANEKILELDPKKCNVAGGAVSLGHPIGSSGARIIVTLINLLKGGELGAAAICNGGGGASSLVIRKI
ncbi:Thiolase, N-terminal domain-containing protein [Hyaloraphidium curvatum]|nr:Thiolase, N-terminal domain-containing protein [Hyaloraphidium curvatum]